MKLPAGVGARPVSSEERAGQQGAVHERTSRAPLLVALVVVFALAIAVRIRGLFDGIPYAVGIDEPAILERVLRMLQTGDWNPHFFDYPALVFYLQAVVGYLRYLDGLGTHEWSTLAAVDAASLYPAARLLAVAIALAGIYWTYLAGRELESRRLGLVAAAQVAVFPQLVRDSHYVLTDVPATSFVMLALWLAFRAARTSTVSSYALAGAAAGLAAAAKYNGGFVLVAILVLWAAYDHRSPDFRKPVAAVAGVGVVFFAANPYVLLDWAGFRQQFAELVGRYTASRVFIEPVWLTYLKHLSRPGAGWLPAVAAGLVLGLFTGRRRREWLAVTVFVLGYFCVLATHAPVFARYTLPMIPALCLLAALPVVRLAESLAGRLGGRLVPAAVLLAGAL